MNPLKRLRIRSPFPTEGYRIYQAGRETFIYEEPQRKARIVGQMLTKGDRLYYFRLDDAVSFWDTAKGTEPLSKQERGVIFDRLREYMQARRLSYEVEE